MLSRLVVIAVGLVLTLGGLGLFFSGGIALPTRTPPLQFRFSGVPLLLLGTSALLWGGVCLAIAFRRLDRTSRVTRVLVGMGIALVALSFGLAPKS